MLFLFDRGYFRSKKTDSFWDHKWQLSALFPSMGLSRRYHHNYNGKEITYYIWLNIHFGVICSVVYKNDTKYMINGAGQAQKLSDKGLLSFAPFEILFDYICGLKTGSQYDRKEDNYYIREGIRLYQKQGSNISAYDLLSLAISYTER